MKKRYTLAVLGLALASQLSAQVRNPHWAWARRDGNITYSINPDYPRQVVAAAGNRVLWGTVQNQRMLYNTMLGDYHVQEMDSSGNPTAMLRIEGKLSLLQARCDAAGNWYILGTFYDSLKIGSSPLILRSQAESDRFLIRLRAGTLALDWFTFVGGDSYCNTSSFIVDGNAAYLSIDSANASHIVRYELSNGGRSPQMNQNTRSSVVSIARDGFGGTYVLGTCVTSASFDFNGTNAGVPLSIDYPWYLVHYGPSGAYDWHYFMNDITCTDRALNRVAGGGVYLSGDLMDSASIGALQFQKAQNEDNYLMAKLANDGSVSWSGQRPVTSVSQGNVRFGGPGKSLSTDSFLIAAPESQGISVWGPGGIQTNTTGMNGNIVGYAANTGEARWAKAIDADYSNIQQITSDGSSVYVTGLAMDLNSIDFDNVSIPTASVPYKYVPYLAKLHYGEPNLKAEPTTLAYGIYVWPNPVTSTINLHTSDRGPLRILDVQGRRIWSGDANDKGDLSIDVAGWQRGIYFLQQPAFGREGIFKLVLQ